MSGLQTFIKKTLYKAEAANNPTTAYSASWSTGKSGLSYGYMQNDIGNNKRAYDGLIAVLQADGILGRDAEQIVARAAASSNSTTILPQDLATINGALSRQHDAVNSVDTKQVQKVTEQTLSVIKATKSQGAPGSGVLDPSNPDFGKAVGRIASWVNRTGEPSTLKQWVEGKPVTLNEKKSTDPQERQDRTVEHPLQLDHPPTLQDIDDYLSKTREYSPINEGGNGSNLSSWLDNIGNAVGDALSSLTGLISDALGWLNDIAGGWGDDSLAGGSGGDTLGGSPSTAPDIAAGLCGVAAGVPVATPIVLDLDGDGISLVALEDSAAYFDLDNDGFREKTQWVAGTDGLLALDANANGRIDDKAELFGDEAGFADGYAKLASHDSNADGVIDASDAVFADLRIWQDADSDGYTDEGELKTLAELGIASLSLTADSTLSSTYTRTDGATGQTQDAFFEHDQLHTIYGGEVNLSAEALFLPWLRGYGQVADLPMAMGLALGKGVKPRGIFGRNLYIFLSVLFVILHVLTLGNNNASAGGKDITSNDKVRSFHNWKSSSFDLVSSHRIICGSRKIAFASEDGINLLDVFSGKIEKISDSKRHRLLECSEDATLLFYSNSIAAGDEKNSELYAYDLIHNTKEKIYETNTPENIPSKPLSPNGRYIFYKDHTVDSNMQYYKFKRGDVVKFVPQKVANSRASWTYFNSILSIYPDALNSGIRITLHNLETQSNSSAFIKYESDICVGIASASMYSDRVIYLGTDICTGDIATVRPTSIPAIFKLTINSNGSYTSEPVSFAPKSIVSPTGRIIFIREFTTETEESAYMIIANDGGENTLVGEISNPSSDPLISISSDGNLILCRLFLERPSWLPRSNPFFTFDRYVVFFKS